MAAFIHLIESHIPLNENVDRVWCKLKMNGDFNIHSFYSDLRGFSSPIFLGKAFVLCIKKKKKRIEDNRFFFFSMRASTI